MSDDSGAVPAMESVAKGSVRNELWFVGKLPSDAKRILVVTERGRSASDSGADCTETPEKLLSDCNSELEVERSELLVPSALRSLPPLL